MPPLRRRPRRRPPLRRPPAAAGRPRTATPSTSRNPDPLPDRCLRRPIPSLVSPSEALRKRRCRHSRAASAAARPPPPSPSASDNLPASATMSWFASSEAGPAGSVYFVSRKLSFGQPVERQALTAKLAEVTAWNCRRSRHAAVVFRCLRPRPARRRLRRFVCCRQGIRLGSSGRGRTAHSAGDALPRGLRREHRGRCRRRPRSQRHVVRRPLAGTTDKRRFNGTGRCPVWQRR